MTSRAIPPLAITLPATSANLGPAFDSAAVALRLCLKLRAAASDTFRIRARGRDTEICGRLQSNPLLDTYRDVLASESRKPLPLELRIQNSIPIGKGLGSSAAARLAGILLAVHFGRLGWREDRILAEAARREQHSDNVAACWHGGMVLVHANGAEGTHPKVSSLKLDLRRDWRLLIAVTAAQLKTESARAALPRQYSRADAVSNLQNATLLMAALAQDRPDLVRLALHDRMHEPYRRALCPLLEPLQSLSDQNGVLGAVLSGSGPSVLMVLDPRVPPATTRRRIAGWLRQQGLDAELLLTSIAQQGARVEPAPAARRSR